MTEAQGSLFSPPAPARRIYTVSDFTALLAKLVEDAVPAVWVQGEISNFSKAPSGHWYFTLKDAQSQLRCVMFKSQNFLVRPPPKDGDAVLIRGRAGIYAARGELQLVAEHLEPAGEGALLRAFQQLKARLAAEGLFDEKLKRALPARPRAIGVISSAQGAALQDVLTTLRRRYPLGLVYVRAVPVQGAAAVPAIVAALRQLPRQAPVDVVILARGGGSLEDLWAFNEEAVARAVRACAAPVVTGVGHEIDFTIADFAADRRAATPTAAAEIVSPDGAKWLAQLDDLRAGLQACVLRQLRLHGERQHRLARRVEGLHPARRLGQSAQRLDELGARLRQAIGNRLQGAAGRSLSAQRHLLAVQPGTRLLNLRGRVGQLGDQLQARVERTLRRDQHRLARAAGVLESLSPQAVLERGYAVVRDSRGGIVRDASRLQAHEEVSLRFASGSARARVLDGE